jgi:hypothetical protein
MKSLFNEEIPEIPPVEPKGKYAVWKKDNKYRKATTEEKCVMCKYFYRIEHHAKTYLKCELLGFSNSEATDIRASYVCNRYEKED